MLGQLKAGEKGRITDVSGANHLVQRRLLDFGITDGCEISIKCIMPFGGPFMVECQGQCVGIRRKEACQIRVEREM
jgi:ferrous iron transport protein A